MLAFVLPRAKKLPRKQNKRVVHQGRSGYRGLWRAEAMSACSVEHGGPCQTPMGWAWSTMAWKVGCKARVKTLPFIANCYPTVTNLTATRAQKEKEYKEYDKCCYIKKKRARVIKSKEIATCYMWTVNILCIHHCCVQCTEVAFHHCSLTHKTYFYINVCKISKDNTS